MNSVFRVLVGVKSACNKGFWGFEYHLFKLKNLFTTHYSQFTKKVFAFTLAETLIVMGVIGVVAALTLPNLNSSTGDKEKVVKLQKIYSNLEDALGRATVVYGPSDGWCSGLTDADCRKRHFERITEFMKYSKVCTVSDACTRFARNTSSLGAGYLTPYAIVLPDGATVGFGDRWIYIDIDGIGKGSDIDCKDTFFLFYDNSGMHYTNDKSLDGDKPDLYKCGAWVLMYNNLDYLKCRDLKFNTGKTTCK